MKVYLFVSIYLSFAGAFTTTFHRQQIARTVVTRHRIIGKATLDVQKAIESVDNEGDKLTNKCLTPINENNLQQEERWMRMAIEMGQEEGGEFNEKAAYPNPTVGAVLVTNDGRVIGQGRSDYRTDAIRAVLENAGVEITPLKEWHVSWPTSAQLRQDLANSTLYITLEPSHKRRGTAMPPLTNLIQQVGIPRVVIGHPDPVPELATKGACALHAAGIEVSMGGILEEECRELIEVYSGLVNSKLHRMGRKHFEQFDRPLGFLHCSVVASDNLVAFANNGNAFGTSFGGKTLSFRDFGNYEIAPPPEVIWVPDDDDSYNPLAEASFEEEEYQETMTGNPSCVWYEQVDAVVATFPKPGNGPFDDDSVTARLNGLKWLASHGNDLPPGVERILVLDATDLKELPMSNDDPNLPPNVDVEAFWRAEGRKPSRVLLRRGTNIQARAAAEAASRAAAAAAEAAQNAAAAIEAGDAARAAEVAIECRKEAEKAAEDIQIELQSAQALRNKLESFGVIVELVEGAEPIDILKYLGKRSGYETVVWRAGCWGARGVKAIAEGAFQWISAHLAVDAVGGRFWQLMLAENAIQAACGPERKVKVFADQEDLSLEYCDEVDADADCSVSFEGRPIRHVRLDCRIALFDEKRPREFVNVKTKKLSLENLVEQAPWFL